MKNKDKTLAYCQMILCKLLFIIIIIIIFEMIRALKQIYRFTSIRQRIKQERDSRLIKGVQTPSLTTKSRDDMSQIRNIGIIAHIDAGKTTTTERMLYYAGALPSPGNIEEGNTAMDFLAQERERGITIRSAAISFNWMDHQINLIDTPGHVDFSGEVARSVRVIDGVVTILDGVKGVEAQTQKVWGFSNKNKNPKICFINKMDRIGASLTQTIQSIKNKLKVQPLIIQSPIGDANTFRGVVDLIQLKQIIFEGRYGQSVQQTNIEKNTQKHNHLRALRQNLVQIVGNYDQQIGDMFLNERQVPSIKLKAAIRKIMLSQKLSGKVVPVLLGASFKNLGVQPLLDAIIQYLPGPDERKPVHSINNQTNIRKPIRSAPLSAYIFKVIFDLEQGQLTFARIYSGKMQKNADVYNSTKQLKEKIAKILRVRANLYVPIDKTGAGDIIALTGLSRTEPGDTLIGDNDNFILQKLQIPSPVFTAPFQLQTAQKQRQFSEAMNKSVLEDTSLSVKFQQETGQYLVSGLGQLHLEILRDRIKAQGIPVKMGNLKINYKQTVGKTMQDSLQIKKQLKLSVFEQFNLTINLLPLRAQNGSILSTNKVIFTFEKVPQFNSRWDQFVQKKNYQKNPNEKKLLKKGQTKQFKKIIRNPTPLQPVQQEQQPGQQEEQQVNQSKQLNKQNQGKQKVEEEIYYSINTLPFETLYELYETCQTSLLYGKRKFPAIGIQLQISDGKYKKSSFTKAAMNRCASTLIRQLIQTTAVLIQPIMEFNLVGDELMINRAAGDVIKKRGRIYQQTTTSLTGFIPAESVRGWIRQLRSMGLQVTLKFSDYEEVKGINPQKLLENNQ